MTKHVIKLDPLNPDSWKKAIKELKEYQKKLDKGTERLVELLADIGVQKANVNFSSAMYSGINDVVVTHTNIEKTANGYKATVSADGEAVLFIEFGTGITMADATEERQQLIQGNVLNHGEYGQGRAMNPKGWVYYGERGNSSPFYTAQIGEGKYRTIGNPANSSLYNAYLDLEKEISRCVKEAFQ